MGNYHAMKKFYDFILSGSYLFIIQHVETIYLIDYFSIFFGILNPSVGGHG